MEKSPENLGPGDKLSTNHGGGLYIRMGDHDGGEGGPGIRKFGQEIEYCIWARNAPDADHEYPLLFNAIGDHKPGKLIGHGRKLLEVLLGHGIKVKTLVADRAYTPGAKVPDLQLPYAIEGINLVMDYGIKQFGHQAYFTSADLKHDLVMCDGSWYLGTMTTTLRDSELEYAKALKAAAKIKNKATRAHAVVRRPGHGVRAG